MHIYIINIYNVIKINIILILIFEWFNKGLIINYNKIYLLFYIKSKNCNNFLIKNVYNKKKEIITKNLE